MNIVNVIIKVYSYFDGNLKGLLQFDCFSINVTSYVTFMPH